MKFEDLKIGDKFIEHTEIRDATINVFIKTDELKSGDYGRNDINAITLTGKDYYFYPFSKIVKLLM